MSIGSLFQLGLREVARSLGVDSFAEERPSLNGETTNVDVMSITGRCNPTHSNGSAKFQNRGPRACGSFSKLR